MAQNGKEEVPVAPAAVLKAQEDERRRIAREIHDGPAQTLANLIFRVEVCQKLLEVDPGQAKEELVRLKEFLRAGLKDVRQIIADLSPLAVEEAGLVEALRRYADDFGRRTDLVVSFAVHGRRRRFPPEVAITAYRLVQESLTNVAKHARAQHVSVAVTAGGGGVTITVVDDGCGFDPQAVRVWERQGSFGLRAMAERARLVGGSLHVHSSPGAGTIVEIWIPTRQAKAG